MANQNGFFAVEKDRFHKACQLGMNAAVAYLVLCNGTEKSNTTTAWSVHAIESYTGISRGRAKKAIETLKEYQLITQIKEGSRPRYRVKDKQRGKLDSDAVVWLPSGLVQGVADETPPLERVRGTQEVMVLRMLFDFYGVHDLIDEGGLPKYIFWTEHDRKKLGQYAEYNIYGFTPKNFSRTRSYTDVLQVHADDDYKKKEKENRAHLIFERLELLVDCGALVSVPYVYDSDNDEGEPVHHLDGDVGAVARDACYAALSALGYGADAVYDFHYVVPVPRDKPNATVITTYQLRYKPKTKLTSKWFYERSQREKKVLEMYQSIATKAAKTLGQNTDKTAFF